MTAETETRKTHGQHIAELIQRYCDQRDLFRSYGPPVKAEACREQLDAIAAAIDEVVDGIPRCLDDLI